MSLLTAHPPPTAASPIHGICKPHLTIPPQSTPGTLYGFVAALTPVTSSVVSRELPPIVLPFAASQVSAQLSTAASSVAPASTSPSAISRLLTHLSSLSP